MQVSASDHCAKTILFTVSILAKVQINEDCLLRNVESWESWTLADAANLVSRGFLVANAAVLGFQESSRYQESCCPFQSRARISRALNNFCGARRIYALALVQCLASVANSMGIRAAIQFISITRAQMQVLTSDQFALQRVRSMNRVSFAMLCNIS